MLTIDRSEPQVLSPSPSFIRSKTDIGCRIRHSEPYPMHSYGPHVSKNSEPQRYFPLPRWPIGVNNDAIPAENRAARGRVSDRKCRRLAAGR